MLYIIGLGLNSKGISQEGLEAVNACTKVFLESYTVDFPYEVDELESVIGKKITKLEREDLESDYLVKVAMKKDIALLIYGAPLFATTHMTLINDCHEEDVEVKVIYSASVFDSVAETGLQLYKFGKISSMPKWFESFKPTSFMNYVKENQSIKAHSIILVDIGLSYKKAIEQLKTASNKVNVYYEKYLVCSNLGTNDSKIYYGNYTRLKEIDVKAPFLFIIPAELHFIEKEIIEKYEI